MTIIVGLILIPVGLLMSIFNEKMLNTFGEVPFAEQYMRLSGGSRLFYILLGMAVTFIGFLIITGLFSGLAIGLLGPLFRF